MTDESEQRCRRAGLIALMAIVLPLCIPQDSFAHREDYIDETVVFLTLERHAFEPEYWYDAGRQTQLRQNWMRHNLSAEFGITEHWMVDGRASFRHNSGESTRFESGRFETRLRFGNEGDRPVDIAASGEVNVVRSESGHHEYGLEPRLILSRDFGELNLTANVPLEISLDNGTASVFPAFGIRYDASESFRVGSEVKYDTDTDGGAVVPQVWMGLSPSLTLKAGYSQPFAQNHEHFLRLALEAEF